MPRRLFRILSAATPPPGDAVPDVELLRRYTSTRDAAYAIINGKGATYYAVAAGLMRIVEAILRDQGTVLSVSSLIDDPAFGAGEVCFSLPTVVGRGGVEKVLRLDLSPSETAALRHSVDVLRASIAQLGL